MSSKFNKNLLILPFLFTLPCFAMDEAMDVDKNDPNNKRQRILGPVDATGALANVMELSGSLQVYDERAMDVDNQALVTQEMRIEKYIHTFSLAIVPTHNIDNAINDIFKQAGGCFDDKEDVERILKRKEKIIIRIITGREVLNSLMTAKNCGMEERKELTNDFVDTYRQDLFQILQSLHIGSNPITKNEKYELLKIVFENMLSGLNDYIVFENSDLKVNHKLVDYDNLSDGIENALFKITLSFLHGFKDKLKNDKIINILFKTCNALTSSCEIKRRCDIFLAATYLFEGIGLSTQISSANKLLYESATNFRQKIKTEYNIHDGSDFDFKQRMFDLLNRKMEKDLIPMKETVVEKKYQNIIDNFRLELNEHSALDLSEKYTKEPVKVMKEKSIDEDAPVIYVDFKKKKEKNKAEEIPEFISRTQNALPDMKNTRNLNSLEKIEHYKELIEKTQSFIDKELLKESDLKDLNTIMNIAKEDLNTIMNSKNAITVKHNSLGMPIHSLRMSDS